MKLEWIAAACLALTGCATSEPGLTRGAAPRAGAEPAPVPSEVREVSIESFSDLASCRRYVATGTRIAVVRCESKTQSADDRLAYEQTKQDLESMRRQQMYQEQARQQAIAEAARRRAGP